MGSHILKRKLPSLRFKSENNLEVLKWVALILMTGDHINKYLFNETLPYLFEAGRLAMPIFIFVIAYNMGRESSNSKIQLRCFFRLFGFGVVSSIPFISMGGLYYGWWPLNILFTLAALCLIIYFIEKKNIPAAIVCFLVMGSSVEFWWPALVLGLSVWSYKKNPNIFSIVLGVLSCASLFLINQNMWALMAIPTIFLFSTFNGIKIPRMKWFFYFYYPLHLFLLLLIRILMAEKGYLFF